MHIPKVLVRLFIFAAMVLVLIPCLQQGMFLDGVNYANVANNLANGKGTMWYFTYSDTFLSHYTHQLPFMLWCQGLFFYIFGDSELVERLFCLILLLLNSLAISALWKESYPDQKHYSGWPLLLWLTTPIVFWGFANNVQELMMSLCSVWSLTYILRYLNGGRAQHLLTAGVFCFLCAFCKGPQGLFMLIAIPLHHLFVQRRPILKVVQDQLLFTLPTIAFAALLWLYIPARNMLVANFESRLKSTFVDEVQDTTAFRFDLWLDLIAELLVPVGLCVLLILLVKASKRIAALHWNRHSTLLMLIGLSASLPLIVTLEQRRFYLITSIPFFVIALAGIFVPLLATLRLREKTGQLVNYCLLTLTALAFIYGLANTNTYKRDKELLTDVQAIGKLAPAQTISADPALIYHYSLIAYLARQHNVSLDFTTDSKYVYHLSLPNSTAKGHKVYSGIHCTVLKR